MLTANYKETIYRLPKEMEEKCLEHLLKNLLINGNNAASVFFMNEDMIKELYTKDLVF